jgi:hypothetical protein
MASFLRSYDLAIKAALYTKFASILGIDTQSSLQDENINLGVFQFPKEVALRVAAEKRGETFLEFINYWKMGASFSWARNRTPLSRRGLWMGTPDAGNPIYVKAVPIDINYNAWFWSKDLDKIYQVIETYVFWQQKHPSLSLLYDDTYTLQPDLHFGEIVDESTVGEQFEKGIMYVYRMPIKLDAWVLEDAESSKIIQKIKITVRDQDEVTDYDEIIVEDSNQNTELDAILRFSREAIYHILEIDLSTNTIDISGSFAADFIVDQKIYIKGSTGNDNVYTIVSSSFADEKTSIVLSETLVDDTADGIVSLKTV